MSKLIPLLLLLCFSFSNHSIAQQTQSASESIPPDSLLFELRKIQDELSRAMLTIRTLRANHARIQADQDSLRLQLLNLSGELDSRTSTLLKESLKLSLKVDSSTTALRDQIATVGESVQSRTWIGILVVILVFAIISYVMWMLLFDMPNQFDASKRHIDEQIVEGYTSLTERLGDLLTAAQAFGATATNATPDHSLALKVANEINTMERNLSLMDSKIRGYKQLRRSVESLRDNLNASGYDVPVLLGSQFVSGMNAQIIESLQDDNEVIGFDRITKIIVPQVNYNGVLIQAAQVEVSFGTKQIVEAP